MIDDKDDLTVPAFLRRKKGENLPQATPTEIPPSQKAFSVDRVARRDSAATSLATPPEKRIGELPKQRETASKPPSLGRKSRTAPKSPADGTPIRRRKTAREKSVAAFEREEKREAREAKRIAKERDKQRRIAKREASQASAAKLALTRARRKERLAAKKARAEKKRERRQRKKDRAIAKLTRRSAVLDRLIPKLETERRKIADKLRSKQ